MCFGASKEPWPLKYLRYVNVSSLLLFVSVCQHKYLGQKKKKKGCADGQTLAALTHFIAMEVLAAPQTKHWVSISLFWISTLRLEGKCGSRVLIRPLSSRVALSCPAVVSGASGTPRHLLKKRYVPV